MPRRRPSASGSTSTQSRPCGPPAPSRRDTAYSETLAELVRAFPDDQEAKAFYALSLLGLSGTTRTFASYMRAAAVPAEVFRANPTHPGGAHYLIHSFDDPIHAPLGLPAARAYSRIAPDAAHAQHMTTHIFLALGMWDEVVSQNEVAAGLTGWGPGHYTAWLEYGLLQQGHFADARAHLERIPTTPATTCFPATAPFAFIRSVGESQQMVLVLNLFDELRARATK